MRNNFVADRYVRLANIEFTFTDKQTLRMFTMVSHVCARMSSQTIYFTKVSRRKAEL